MDLYDDSDCFELSRKEWKALSQERSWYTTFGDLYAVRYPLQLSDSSGAQSIKKSIFLGDDSVHAWDAKGIRQTIVNQVISAEERGKIRPWYAELGFYCESIVYLRGLKEDDIDFVLRTSLQFTEKFEDQEMKEAINIVKNLLDPEMPKNPDGTINEFEMVQLQEKIIMESSLTLEMFGLLSAIGKKLFIMSREDMFEVFKIILDPENADKYLRKRFVETGQTKEEFRPFIGKFHRKSKASNNMVLEYIGGGSEKFYRFRIMQLWLYALLSDDDQNRNFLRKENADIFYFLENIKLDYDENQLVEKYLEIIYRTVALIKLESIYGRLTQQIKIEYASIGDYKDYSNKIFHLLKDKKEIVERFNELGFPYDKGRYKTRSILHSFGLVIIESVLIKLEKQIPEPQIETSQKRAVMSKRKNALRNGVLTKAIKEELIEEVLKIEEIADETVSSSDFVKYVRKANEVLVPRGEEYFKDMQERVEEIMAQYGEDVVSEVKQKMDTPESLIKQFGKEAIRFLRQQDVNVDLLNSSDIYAIVLALKSTEIMFDDATTNRMRKNRITNSLYLEQFKPMVEMLRTFYRTSDETEVNDQEGVQEQ